MTVNATVQVTSNGLHSKPPLLARLLRLYLCSRLRGSTRLTYSMAHRLESLQHVPLDIPHWAPVYVDLRLGSAHTMLMESPYKGLWRELDEVKIMQRFVRAGDVALDIGANVGLHSILLSRLVGPQGKLFAFEPNAELLPSLRYTLAHLGNVRLHPIALSNRHAESQLFVPPDDSVASLADWTVTSPIFSHDGPAHVVNCSERRLDDLVESGVIPQPDFIKCDVEGAELQVFQGALNTLNRPDAPIVLFEANECASRAFGVEVSAAKHFLSALENASYRFLEIRPGGNLVKLAEPGSNFMNVLAIPESKLSFWPDLQGGKS